MSKVLFVATVVKTHIMHFHLPALRMFKENGWETAVAARNDYEDPNDCQIPYCDYYFNIEFSRNPFSLENVRAYKEMRKLLLTEQFDIIHCHTPVGGVIARLAARPFRKSGVRVLYTAHGFHFYTGAPLKNWLLYYPAEWLCAHWTDVLITINKEDYERAKKHMHAKRVEYVPGVGIDTKRFMNATVDRAAKWREIGVPEDATLLISVGELIVRKNHSVIIKALARLNDKRIHYVIIGSGQLKDELEALAKTLEVSPQVHLLGYQSDIPRLYKAADICMFPSIQEGLPVAVMEAMACGLPIIASKIRGTTDLLTDSGNVLCTYDDVSAYTRAIRRFSDSLELRDSVGAENQKRAEAYDVAAINERMKEIYSVGADATT